MKTYVVYACMYTTNIKFNIYVAMHAMHSLNTHIFSVGRQYCSPCSCHILSYNRAYLNLNIKSQTHEPFCHLRVELTFSDDDSHISSFCVVFYIGPRSDVLLN